MDASLKKISVAMAMVGVATLACASPVPETTGMRRIQAVTFVKRRKQACVICR